MAPPAMKKVLLMGRSGSGKTSMRSVIFQNTLPDLTHRLGATIDVEQSHQRFLGSAVLRIWDAGGQGSFMDNYLSVQRSTIFAHVGILIYVFDVETSKADWDLDTGYFIECLAALAKYSPDAITYVLIHKMDLVPPHERANTFARKRAELLEASGGKFSRVFGTSIWDETLYKAWSHIVHAIIPNADALTKSLVTLTRACGAIESVVFEKTTFLLVAHSEGFRSTTDEDLLFASASSSPVSTYALTDHAGSSRDGISEKSRLQATRLPGNRFERFSSLLKIFKLKCPRWTTEQWSSLYLQLPNYTAVIEPLTSNSYVMILGADDRITPEAIRINVRLARPRFEELQAGLA